MQSADEKTVEQYREYLKEEVQRVTAIMPGRMGYNISGSVADHCWLLRDGHETVS